jgi:ASPIC/UnbV protein/VCBS repeat protein
MRQSENVLYRNAGPSEGLRARKPGCGWRFTNVAREAHVNEQIHSFPTWFFDYDNDGNEDLFVSGYMITELGDITRDVLGLPTEADKARLYRNNGDGTFADVSRAVHLDHVLQAMGSNYGDFDNDGWLDMLIGTGNPDLGTLIPDRAFRNDGGRSFQDVTTSGGFGHLQKGHGVSFGDIDNDGDQDIYHAVGGAYESDHFRHALYRNPGHGNHFLVLKLEGVRSNRAAIGARIKVVVTTPHGGREIWKTVRSGGSFGASPLRQEIGLGDAQRIERIDILWPSGGMSRLGSLALDRRYVIREGATAATPLVLRPFRLGGAAAAQRQGGGD